MVMTVATPELFSPCCRATPHLRLPSVRMPPMKDLKRLPMSASSRLLPERDQALGQT